MQILLVINNKEELKKCREYVTELYPNHEIMAFADSEAAADYVQSHEVDVCFSDMLMSPVTGIALLKKIRVRNGKARVIFLAEDASFALEAWRVFANDFLLKPITKQKIMHAGFNLQN